MKNYYTNGRNIQMIIALMKAHNIRKVIASPGTINIPLVGSLQNDPYFEIYSSVDERSAAYIACGIAEESKEPVALTCTGATASRNYVPGLTEAYYRKLPVLALTATQHTGKIGQNIPQVLDRSTEMNDIIKYNAQVPIVHSDDDEEACAIEINKAMLELRHNGGGPAMINYTTTHSEDYSVKEISPVHIIDRICYKDELPKINANKIGIFVGAHLPWNIELTKAVEEFCEKYNGVVLCDQTSNYCGKYAINGTLVVSQKLHKSECEKLDLLIDIGDVSGSYYNPHANEVWRVNPDGEIRQRGNKIRYVFEMEEIEFFNRYNSLIEEKKNISYYEEWILEDKRIREKIPELPFSNIWASMEMFERLPKDSTIHLGILNTLRSWNFNPLLKNNRVFSNTGGFGIDGNTSSLIGTSLASPNKLHFGFFGDLAFFYDLNAIGNRHVGNNIRILVINNGRGGEFRLSNNMGQRVFGNDADKYIAAAGHFGNQSKDLLKHYTIDLGFEYMKAENKEEFLENIDKYMNPNITDKPIFFEVFTDYNNEREALDLMYNIEISNKNKVKKIVKDIVGERRINEIKKMIK